MELNPFVNVIQNSNNMQLIDNNNFSQNISAHFLASIIINS